MSYYWWLDDATPINLRDILRAVLSSKAYERGTCSDDGGFQRETCQKLAKQLCQRKIVDWQRYLDTECPRGWEEGIMYWATRQKSFKAGDIIKQAEEAKGNDEVEELLSQAFHHGIRGIVLLKPKHFDWWWAKFQNGSCLGRVMMNGDEYYAEEWPKNEFDMKSIPPTNLDKLIIAWLSDEDDTDNIDCFEEFMLLRALELSLEVPCSAGKVKQIISQLSGMHLEPEDKGRFAQLKFKIDAKQA